MSSGRNGSDFDTVLFQAERVMGILRGVDNQSLGGVLRAAQAGGLRFIEITLNTDNALALIEQSNELNLAPLCIGAGTVLNLEQARLAHSVGARFLVSPTLNEEVANYCKDQNVPYFPGALTPTEIEKAWSAGAFMVKVFPVEKMGADYLKMIKGPFQDISLMAVGGVSAKNVSEYLNAGASAVAMGGSIFSSKRMQEKAFEVIQKEIQEFMLPVQAFCSKK
jgi:2-dehydro-3-deoxyphosphogluconate aldolase / (4S)-4-hydroxy-2-oxoglutarate aldolase